MASTVSAALPIFSNTSHCKSEYLRVIWHFMESEILKISCNLVQVLCYVLSKITNGFSCFYHLQFKLCD